MIDDAKTFFAWFQGYTEDIDGAPSERQWKRIKGQIDELAKVIQGAPVAAPAIGGTIPLSHAVEPAPKPKPKPTNISEWLLQYKEALVELGLDEESAVDFTEEYGEDNPPNIALDPAAEAKANVGPMLNN